MTHFKLATYSSGDPAAETYALLLPGLCDTKDYPHMRGHVEYLADLGFYAQAIDMPGTWESGDEIREFTTTNCLQAINDRIAEVDKPTIIIGHSNGGRLAVLSATRNPNIRAIVCIMSATTTYTTEQATQWQADGIKTSHRDHPADSSKTRRFDLPFSFCQDAMQYDAPAELRQLRIPKLFIAGQHDTIVTPAEVQRTFQQAAKPKELLVLDSDHDYRRNPAIIGEVNDVLRRYLTAQELVDKSL